jgi:hypothetical protein
MTGYWCLNFYLMGIKPDIPRSMLRGSYLVPPLEKGDSGGLNFVKSPLAPLFQRGES